MSHSPSKPTIVASASFDVTADGDTLRAAMRGLGTDEEQIIDLLTRRSNGQRQAIAAYFRDTLERDVIDDLRSELGGDFENVIVGLMREPVEYLCEQLNSAMVGAGTDERVLIEILCTMNNADMSRLVQRYEELYGRPLAEHMCSETDGPFRRLLTLIVTGVRDETGTIDETLAAEQAEQLWQAGEAKLGTDEEVFNRILSHSSFEHLRVVFEAYKNVSGQTIEHAIEHEIDGDLQDAYLAIVECVQSPAAFFAQCSHRAIDGAGTDDSALIRIVVSRAEIDLGNIKDEYERIYNRTLLSAIKNETGGDYGRVLCAIIGNA